MMCIVFQNDRLVIKKVMVLKSRAPEKSDQDNLYVYDEYLE
jgi:hypothetical protein